jgi:hypothetical protein
MSQNKKRVGRPPKSPSWIDKDFQVWSKWYRINPTSSDLVWRIPLNEIVAGIQTINGIARLAAVSRKTVYRKKIMPGGSHALNYIVSVWKDTARPLVRHKDAAHEFNLGEKLVKALKFCSYRKQGRSNVVQTMIPDPSDPIDHWKRNWKRKEKHSPNINPIFETEKQRKETMEAKRLGKTFVSQPQGRITAKMVCSVLNIPRREFYRWEKNLTLYNRKLLRAEMGKTSKKKVMVQNDFGCDTFYDFNYDQIKM